MTGQIFNNVFYSISKVSRPLQKTKKKISRTEKRVQQKPASLTASGYSSVRRRVIDLDDRTKVLPEKLLSDKVLHLKCESSSAKSGFCDVYVVGTCHISKESCREVQNVIRFLKPQVGFLEWSPESPPAPPEPLTLPALPWSIKKLIINIIRIILMESTKEVYLILGSMISVKHEDILEVRNGNEFYVASKEIKSYGGKIILGDIPDEVTYERTWAKLPFWHRLKLIYDLVYDILFLDSSAEDLEREITQTMSQDEDEATQFYEEFPTYKETFIDERDQYMSCLLHKTASEHSSVVAVVGRAHLPGIKQHWKQPVDMDELVKMPPLNEGICARATESIASFVIGLATILTAIAFGIYIYFKPLGRYFLVYM